MIDPDEPGNPGEGEGEGEPMPDDVLNGPPAIEELFDRPVTGNGVLGDTLLSPQSPQSE